MKTNIDTSITPALSLLPGFEFTAQLAVINYRAEHRAKAATMASLKAKYTAVIADNKNLSNDTARKAAMETYLTTDDAAVAAGEAYEDSLSQIALLEAEAAYYRHLRQTLCAEIDQRKLDTL
jgi:hypothetical protein